VGRKPSSHARGEKRPEINWTEAVNHLPLQTALDSVETKSKFVADTLKHSSYDEFWQKMSIQNDYPEMDVPVFHITGWYDDLESDSPVRILVIGKNE
jgi:predicted acyl esterase